MNFYQPAFYSKYYKNRNKQAGEQEKLRVTAEVLLALLKISTEISSDVNNTQSIASIKLMMRTTFNFLFKSKEANMATITGIVKVIIPAFAANVKREPKV